MEKDVLGDALFLPEAPEGLQLFLQVEPGAEEAQRPLRHIRINTAVDSQQGIHILFIGFFIEIDAIDNFTKHVEINVGGFANNCQFFGLRVEYRQANDVRINIGNAPKPGDEFRLGPGPVADPCPTDPFFLCG